MLKFWEALIFQIENFRADFFRTTGFRNVGKFIEMLETRMHWDLLTFYVVAFLFKIHVFVKIAKKFTNFGKH